ncbi:MAG: hypothetical protein HN884_04525, partial [Rhodospirillaceae bacterium]|nr:hypothetical protein [Rhodospirillaceae bacterium]
RDDKAVIAVVEGAVSEWTEQVRARWREIVADVEVRITVVPRQSPEDFIALQNAADVILDTPHFSGGNTSFEAFALAKPVVTYDGALMRGRVTAGMYRAMGITECIAENIEDYIKIALKLGLDERYRIEISERLRISNEILFNGPNVVAEFENFFKSALPKG